MKVVLPEKPVDGFELVYFTIRHQRQVEEIRLKYHIYTKWNDVSDDEGGADIVDQWQVFCDGYFSGRMDGWLSPSILKYEWDFETREEAATALKDKLEEWAAQLDKRAREYRERAERVA